MCKIAVTGGMGNRCRSGAKLITKRGIITKLCTYSISVMWVCDKEEVKEVNVCVCVFEMSGSSVYVEGILQGCVLHEGHCEDWQMT